MAGPERRTLAWSFKTALSQQEMLKRLDASWPSVWSTSESHYHGDFITGRLTPEAVARIYEDESRFVVHLRFFSKAGDPSALLLRAQQELIGKVLPAIDARDVEPTEPLD